MRDLIRDAGMAGSHFFDEGTMEFWNTTLESQAYHTNDSRRTRFFITGEYMDEPEDMMYTIRVARGWGDSFTIDTVGLFMGHPSLTSATTTLAAYMDAMLDGMTHDDLDSRLNH